MLKCQRLGVILEQRAAKTAGLPSLTQGWSEAAISSTCFTQKKEGDGSAGISAGIFISRLMHLKSLLQYIIENLKF